MATRTTAVPHGIIISQTFERWTFNDIEDGATDDRGFIYAAELVDLMREHDEPSNMPTTGDTGTWLTRHNANEGSREWYEYGTTVNTSIHYDRLNGPRAAKYWRKAMIAAGIITV